MNKIPMTKSGAEQLREELALLKTVNRPSVVAAIAEAREHGDLKENAEYHAAKERQSFIEGRIIEIESKLSNAEIIDIANMPKTGKVIFGATVRVLNLETEQTVQYQIVGEDEADIKVGKIFVSSPLARSMIGKQQDDVFEVQTPKGVVEYEVLAVEYT